MFKFRFATLLKVKKIRNEMAQQALAEAQRAYLALQGERSDCLRKIAGAGDELLSLFEHVVRPGEIEMFYHYQRFLRERVKELDQALEDMAREVEQRREELLKTRREYKAIERLKEIHYERYHIEQERLEMKAIDDMAVTRHARAQ